MMGGPDSFYTPVYMAEQLVGYVQESDVHTIADFCVGDGRLLTAVHKRFPNAQLFGMDIAREIVNKLANQHADWVLTTCDFIDDEKVDKIVSRHLKEFDLILLNPPFSCKGSIINIVECEGIRFKVSTAMMFILKAIRFLSKNGGMYAILPISCVYSQKDRRAWKYLEKQYNACVLSEHSRISFAGKCAPNIALVYIGNQRHEIQESQKQSSNILSSSVIKVTRGSVRMQGLKYTEDRKGIRLIHTTNLLNGKLVNVSKIEENVNSTECGYGVLIPRVCNPNLKKIVLLKKLQKFVLSDCVIFLKTETVEQAQDVYNSIINNWQVFVRLYSGTGAQYTTIERVKAMFPVPNNGEQVLAKS